MTEDGAGRLTSSGGANQPQPCAGSKLPPIFCSCVVTSTMSLAWRGPSGQPTHSLLHFLSVRPLQHPFSLRCVASLLWGAGEISSRS
jgi:hypothetical protein